MSDPTDVPYSPLRDALTSMLGRLGLVLGAVLLGVLLGAISATGSLLDGAGLALRFPAWAFSSVFFGPGIVVGGFLLVFAILYSTWEWPRWLACVAVALMWWNAHETAAHLLFLEEQFAKIVPTDHVSHVSHSP
jgi:hypothetical protein